MPTMFVPTKDFIADLFMDYINNKKQCMFNYISDETVKGYLGCLRTISTMEKYKEWFDTKICGATTELERYKVILSILLDCDRRVSAGTLEYSVHEDGLVLVTGKKRWNETKLTIGSCPFQKIRGIVLNETELKRYNDAKGKIGGMEMFTDGKLCVAASHANQSSELGLKAQKKLSFGNIGITAFSKSDDVQKLVIGKSILHAKNNNAKILIFPELAINENNLDHLVSELNRNGKEIKLVVGGSYYKPKDSAFENLAPIYANISGQWEKITEYAKMIPFSMSYTQKTADAFGIDTTEYPLSQYKLLTENLSMDDNITLLPFKDCIIGVAICRDAMDLLDSHNPLHKYCDFVDIMLVISDNRGDSNMFVGTAECLARWHNCATVYTNSRGPLEADPHLEMSFAIYPFKKSDSRNSTAVSGEITYEKKPFELRKADGENMVGILFSPGIKYAEFTSEELENCCKIYTVEEAK